MKKVELRIIPFAKENEVKTLLVVDGRKIDSKDNRLTNLVVYQPMRKWLNPYKKKLFVWEGLLAEIIEEFNDRSIHFVFNGCKADYTLFRKSILLQQTKLNRNGGDARVTFELADNRITGKTVKELLYILDDLRVEADNWGEDDIIDKIDRLKDELSGCRVALKTEYFSSPAEFENLLRNQHISIRNDSVLTVIPVDGSVPVSGIRDFIAELVGEGDAGRNILVINTSTQENNALVELVISFDGGSDSNIRYIENDGENYISEIEKTYYMAVFPGSIQKTTEILHMFPDYDTNNFLIDISYRTDDLFCGYLK